ncbi:ral guanine nucleotide dissociation stimulator-like [Dipodomys spectabilis]|uniref:ral guanine nucleotide dissociation stimulator-like n=1 Tax=Dipodomys spectabilis TaxID=105255 RepID=UPI001C542AD9|nr:ral guanine nucleotide dissociation stimulator-like [Dipodomys spectabilis]
MGLHKNEKESVPTQEEHHRVSTLEPGMLEKMVNLLVPLHQKEDPFFVPAFLVTYRRFTTTGQVLDLLFKRYAYFQPDCEEDEQIKNTLCSMLSMWLDKYPEDFCQPNDLTNLNKLMAYVLLNMPSADLAVRVHLLLTQLEEQETKEADKNREEFLDLGLHTAPAPEIQAEDVSMMSADVVLESAALPASQDDLVPPQESAPPRVVVQYESSV